MGIDRKDREGRLRAMLENFDFFGAPCGLIITVDKIVDRNGWGHTGMLIMAICLLASQYGLSTCLQEAWSTFNQTVREKLAIPEDQVIWCGISLGFADDTAAVNQIVSEREPLKEVVTFCDSKL